MTIQQQKAMNAAIDSYVIANMKNHGGMKAKPVILIPQFEEETDGSYVPVQSNGVRPTKKEDLAFLRFGMPVVSISANGTPVVKVLKTNVFNDETSLQLLIDSYDMRIGSALPDTVLVVEESLVPFNKKNPDNDLKMAGTTGIACTFTGDYKGITYDNPAPIYRRVKLASAGTGNTLIAHTNADEISKFQVQARELAAKPQSAGIKQAAAKVTGKK